MDNEMVSEHQIDPEAPVAQGKKTPVKKHYMPPVLTLYGKLTELTAGGTRGAPENQGVPGPCNKNKPDERC